MKIWSTTLEISLLILLTLGILIWASYQAQSAPVEFYSVENSPEQPIIAAMFSEYIANRPGIKIYSALIDLDHDRIGEIAIRFVHSQSCFSDQISCRTVILQHDNLNIRQGWLVKFDSFVKALEIFEPNDSNSIHIIADDLVWKFDQSQFQLNTDSKSTELAMELVPAESLEFIVGVFGIGAMSLVNNQDSDIKFLYAFVPTMDKSQILVLSATGTGICGKFIGCPLRIVRKVGNKWNVVLKAGAKDTIKVRSIHRDEIPDISIETPTRLETFGWSGEQYKVLNRFQIEEEY